MRIKHLLLGALLGALLLCGGADAFKSGGVGNLNPTVTYNFLSGSLPSGVTFTRAAGAQSNYNSSGIIVYPGTNVARFDYNPTNLALNGLLMEEARTNALKSSATIGDANWINQNISAATNSVISPDGTADATTITNTSSTLPYAQQSIGSAATGSYANSIFYKQGTALSALIAYSDGVANACNTIFTFSNLTFTSSTAGGCTVASTSYQVLPSGWYRLIMVVNFSATSANILAFSGAWDNAATGAATNGATIYTFGAQSENTQTFATSYIPTTGTAATRAADFASVTSLPWFNNSIGTISENFLIEGIGAVLMRSFSFSDGTANNAIMNIISTNTQANITIAATSHNSANSTTLANVLYKQGIAYLGGNNLSSWNGGTVGDGTGFTASGVPTGINRLDIGNRVAGDRPYTGWIQSFRYWNYNVTQAQLNTITQ